MKNYIKLSIVLIAMLLPTSLFAQEKGLIIRATEIDYEFSDEEGDRKFGGFKPDNTVLIFFTNLVRIKGQMLELDLHIYESSGFKETKDGGLKATISALDDYGNDWVLSVTTIKNSDQLALVLNTEGIMFIWKANFS